MTYTYITLLLRLEFYGVRKMKHKARVFLSDEQGSVGTQIGLGIALTCELAIVAIDWVASSF